MLGLHCAGRTPQPKELLRTYAAMAVIRQTALSLVHHGIHCAHLYFTQSAAELPGGEPCHFFNELVPCVSRAGTRLPPPPVALAD